MNPYLLLTLGGSSCVASLLSLAVQRLDAENEAFVSVGTLVMATAGCVAAAWAVFKTRQDLRDRLKTVEAGQAEMKHILTEVVDWRKQSEKDSLRVQKETLSVLRTIASDKEHES